jgi:hypothetical protein
MTRHVNTRVESTLDCWDNLLGTFEEWEAVSLRDNSSALASWIRHLLRQFRHAVVQRKTALTPLLNSAWAAGPPFTALDELLGWSERDGVGAMCDALSDAIEAFEEIERRKERQGGA